MTQPAVIVIRLDLDPHGEIVTRLMRRVKELIPSSEVWIGTEKYEQAIEELLASWGQPRKGVSS